MATGFEGGTAEAEAETGRPPEVRAQGGRLLVTQASQQREFRGGNWFYLWVGGASRGHKEGALLAPVRSADHPADNLPKCSFCNLPHLLHCLSRKASSSGCTVVCLSGRLRAKHTD